MLAHLLAIDDVRLVGHLRADEDEDDTEGDQHERADREGEPSP